MSVPEMLLPLTDVVTAVMDGFVSWAQEHEWIWSKSLFLVTPGQGLDAKVVELADSVGVDAGTFKVRPRLDRRAGDFGFGCIKLDALTRIRRVAPFFSKCDVCPPRRSLVVREGACSVAECAFAQGAWVS